MYQSILAYVNTTICFLILIFHLIWKVYIDAGNANVLAATLTFATVTGSTTMWRVCNLKNNNNILQNEFKQVLGFMMNLTLEKYSLF